VWHVSCRSGVATLRTLVTYRRHERSLSVWRYIGLFAKTSKKPLKNVEKRDENKSDNVFTSVLVIQCIQQAEENLRAKNPTAFSA